MRTYLVTGGAGFIGSNYIHYMFRKYGDDHSDYQCGCPDLCGKSGESEGY